MTADANGNNGASRGSSVAARFERRWHLTGAGLSNVWRFGDLELPAASGRLLLRGGNGTGKTTALEALLPYLLDLDPARLCAGKARTTTLASLMREGASGKRRIGYAWLVLSEPHEGAWSFGVRLQFSDGASPPVKVVPFGIPGRVLYDLLVHGPGRVALTLEQFSTAVQTIGGQIFEDEEHYVSHLAARLFSTTREDVGLLASRLRQIRNPALLADISPKEAAAALRDSLPGVADDVISATAEALAESDATREAFTRDKEAAEHLEEFRASWCAHATEVVATAHEESLRLARTVRSLQGQVKAGVADVAARSAEAAVAKRDVGDFESRITETQAEIDALENHQAYRDADRLTELKRGATALSRAAELALRAMEETVRRVRERGESVRSELGNLVEDVTECSKLAIAVDPAATPSVSLLTVTVHPRATFIVGDVALDPGPEIVVAGDAALLREVSAAWTMLAVDHEHRADTASVAIIAHQPVDDAHRSSELAAKTARETAALADAALAKAERAEIVASAGASSLLDRIAEWTLVNAQLVAANSRDTGWSVDDVGGLRDAEPARVLVEADRWSHQAIVRAETLAGEGRARAKQLRAECTQLQSEAEDLRAQAAKLHTELLPFPRPEWSGKSDDATALGAVLEWRADVGSARERALLEGTMGAVGLLGATLASDGALTPRWRVDGTGDVAESSLSEVIAVDDSHPLAAAAATVLARVALVESAHTDTAPESVLVVGRDGTFRAGVLLGRIPGADDPDCLGPASHVGARQRREAALAEAARLEQHAASLVSRSEDLAREAAELERAADAIAMRAHTFPEREALRDAEGLRGLASQSCHEAQGVARSALEQQTKFARDHARLRDEWLSRTRSQGLPAEIEQLVRMRDGGKATAGQLRAVATVLSGKLADRLTRGLSQYSATEVAEELRNSEMEAKGALSSALEATTAVGVLEETAGAAIQEILARHEQAKQRLSGLNRKVGEARDLLVETAGHEATARTQLEQLQGRLRDSEPAAARQIVALRALLMVPGVSDAVLDGDVIAEDAQVLAQLTSKLQGRKTVARKTVRERADAVRTRLAGVWAVDPGDDHGDLLTYVLTHRDSIYTPPQAATHAQMLERGAAAALAAKDERALRDFVIGRLPTAISTAWTRLHDWSSEVNRKMRSAAASSGVGVQVRIPLRDDLAAATREVYELACKIADVDRTPEQQRRLADALGALLTAADGDDMHQRVASAVNIREWVDVHYEVTRPGGKVQRWSSRTGLSGGERRLVVLAPMLAAVASAFDRLGDRALRVIALDEVPAEVDDRGRESLARYIAELDLDVVCTSYAWDGCPGAWDGIDAQDLEAGPDETVVAFPMLVRGAQSIPELALDRAAQTSSSERDT